MSSPPFLSQPAHGPISSIAEGQHYIIEGDDNLPFTLRKLLGNGSYGHVIEVQCHGSNEIFALKMLRTTGIRGSEMQAICENEIKNIRSLERHHHVIRVFATYETRREMGLFLQPVADSGNLEEFLENFCYEQLDRKWHARTTQVSILQRAFGCLTDGLAFMHDQSIRHKDIKSRNILIHQGSVIYTDFGSSLCFADSGRSTTTGKPTSLTRRYAAPELMEYEPRTRLSDVFSLGCVFIQIVSALLRAPNLIPDCNFSEDIERIHRELKEIATTNSEHTFTILSVTASMIAENLQDRPTANEILERFRPYSEYFCSQCGDLNLVENRARGINRDREIARVHEIEALTRFTDREVPPIPVFDGTIELGSLTPYGQFIRSAITSNRLSPLVTTSCSRFVDAEQKTRQDFASNPPKVAASIACTESVVSGIPLAWLNTVQRTGSWIFDSLECSSLQQMYLKLTLAQEHVDDPSWWELVIEHWNSNNPSEFPDSHSNATSLEIMAETFSVPSLSTSREPPDM